MCLQRCSATDEHKILNNDLVVGALKYGHIPFLIVRVDKWGTFDGYLQPFAYDEEYRQEFIDADANALHLCATEGPDHIVRVQRMLGVDPDLMSVLRSGYAECAEHFDDGISVNRRVREAYQDFETPEEILEAADETQVFL